jgi:hypothetical protein
VAVHTPADRLPFVYDRPHQPLEACLSTSGSSLARCRQGTRPLFLGCESVNAGRQFEFFIPGIPFHSSFLSQTAGFAALFVTN